MGPLKPAPRLGCTAFASSQSSERGLDVVEMLPRCEARTGVQGAVRVGRPETSEGQGGDALIGLFGDRESETCDLAGRDRRQSADAKRR